MMIALLQMALLFVVGALWRHFQPGGLDVDTLRRAVTTLVYYLLLPALVLNVMWGAPVGWDTLRIAVLAGVGVFAGLLFGWLFTHFTRMPAAVAGAALLAAGFQNATYLGLPVLEASFGPWARSIAIQYDLLACTPLLMSLGMFIAQRYSARDNSTYSSFKALLKVPALWAMIVALILNFMSVQPAEFVSGFLNWLGVCVVPLMLMSIGMSLQWQGGMRGKRIWLSVIAAVQLFLVPLVVLFCAPWIGLEKPILTATVLEAAMPCMVLGIVICDRYNLDTSFYAAAVTVSTLGSLVSLPLWLHVLTIA